MAPTMLLDCNSGLVAVLSVPGTPEEAVATFDTAGDEDDPIVLSSGTDAEGQAWAGGTIPTAGGYYVSLTAVDEGEGAAHRALHRARLTRLRPGPRRGDGAPEGPIASDRGAPYGAADQSSMKMHSPGHSSADSMVASSWPAGTLARPFGAAGIGEDLLAFLHVGEAVVEEREDVRCDLLAEPVAGAEILVDPDLHRVCCLSRRRSGPRPVSSSARAA